MSYVVSKIIWLRGLIKELGIENSSPAKLFYDNEAAIQIAAKPMYHVCTKHIEIDCYFLREQINVGVVKTNYVRSEEQLVDIFTKALLRVQHYSLLSKLGMIDIFQDISLRGSVE